MAEVQLRISASQPLITITYLACDWAEGGSYGSLTTNEGGIYHSESIGAGQEADGYSKDHQQLETYLGPPAISGINHTTNITKSG
jgi:hypothetical protein